MFSKTQPFMKIEFEFQKSSLSVKLIITGSKVDFILMDFIPRNLT